MRKYLFINIYFLSLMILASSAGAHEHREKGAHVHGTAKLDIAFDGTKGKVELHGAGEGFIGFEHEAISVADKKVQFQALDILESKISEIVEFDSGLKCRFLKDRIDLNHEEGGHSEIDSAWSVTCQNSVMGRRSLNFFPVEKFDAL